MIDPPPANQLDFDSLTPKKTLMTMRIIWFALLMGPISFLILLAVLVLPHHVQTNPPQPVLVWVNLVMLATVVPVTFFIRNLIFRRSQSQDGIKAAAYSAGNIVFWAGCEGVAFFGLVIALINGSLWPTIVIVAIALVPQLLTFPVAGNISGQTRPSRATEGMPPSQRS